IVGQFFRQFALPSAVSTLLSALNSLTLSPALAALLLQPVGAKRDPFGRLLDFVLGWFFRLFNVSFQKGVGLYTRLVRGALRVSVLVLVVYVGLLTLTGWGFTRLPSGFIPSQDRGNLMAAVQLPDATSLERTQEVVDHVDRICAEDEGVADRIATTGQSFSLGAFGPNFGQMFIMLKPFGERQKPLVRPDGTVIDLGADAV